MVQLGWMVQLGSTVLARWAMQSRRMALSRRTAQTVCAWGHDRARMPGRVIGSHPRRHEVTRGH